MLMEGSGSVQIMTDPDPGGIKTSTSLKACVHSSYSNPYLVPEAGQEGGAE